MAMSDHRSEDDRDGQCQKHIAPEVRFHDVSFLLFSPPSSIRRYLSRKVRAMLRFSSRSRMEWRLSCVFLPRTIARESFR